MSELSRVRKASPDSQAIFVEGFLSATSPRTAAVASDVRRSRAFQAGAHLGARVASGDATLSGFDAGWMNGIASSQGLETASSPLAVQNIPTSMHQGFRKGVARGQRIADRLGNTAGGNTGNQGGAGGHQTPGSPGSTSSDSSTTTSGGSNAGSGIGAGGGAGSVGGTSVGQPNRGGIGGGSNLAGSEAGGLAGGAPQPDRGGEFNPNPTPGGGNGGGNNGGSAPGEGGLGDTLDTGSMALVDIVSSVFTLAAGLAAITAEGSTTMGKLQGGLMALSGALGLATAGNSLMGMLTGKYFLPDSIAKWGRYAIVANRALAMWEVGKMAFGHGQSVWDKYKDKIDLGDLGKTLGIGGLGDLLGGKESEAAEGNEAVAASGGESAEEVSDALAGLYDFNCLDAGQCYLPGTPSEIAAANAAVAGRTAPGNDAGLAYLDACRMQYPGEESAIWWDVAVCSGHEQIDPATSTFDAAEQGRVAALAQLAKGDAYWSGCVATSPTADVDGSFYDNACGNRWVADDNSGLIVPIWLLMDNPNTARRFGAKFGSEYAVQILRAGHQSPNPARR